MSEEKGNNNFDKLEAKRNVWWLSATSFFTDVSSEMVFPVLPIFLKTVLGTPFAFIGLIEGIAEGLASLLKYFSGLISDKIKKRKGITVVGYGVSVISKIFFTLTNSAFVVLIFRALDRTGKGIRTAPRDALIVESVEPAERGKYFGIHRTADTAGAILGTILAMAILYFVSEASITARAIRLIFFFAVIPAAIGLLFLFKVKEPPVIVKKDQAARKYFDFSGLSGNFKLFLLGAAFFGLANYSYAFYILRAESIGLLLFLVPPVYLIYNIFYAASSYPAGILSDKVGRKTVLVASFILFAAVNLGFAFWVDKTTIWLLFAAYGLFIGLTDGVLRAFVADLSTVERHGEAFGLYYMVTGFTALAGNFLGGVIWQVYGPAWPFLLSIVLTLAAAAVLFFIAKPASTGHIPFKAYRS